MFFLILLALFAAGADAHTIAVVVFIVTMLLWLILGVDWPIGEAPSYRRFGGGLIAWLAVATLAYLTLG